MRGLWGLIGAAIIAVSATACQTSEVDPFVTVNAPLLALTHVRVIDGTGAPGIDDQTVIGSEDLSHVAIPTGGRRPARSGSGCSTDRGLGGSGRDIRQGVHLASSARIASCHRGCPQTRPPRDRPSVCGRLSGSRRIFGLSEAAGSRDIYPGDYREFHGTKHLLRPQFAVDAHSHGLHLGTQRLHSFGTIAPGKSADLVVVRGDPSKGISAVRNVELVFRDGIAYDPRS